MNQQGMGTEGKPQNAAAMIPMKLCAEDVCSSGVSALSVEFQVCSCQQQQK